MRTNSDYNIELPVIGRHLSTNGLLEINKTSDEELRVGLEKIAKYFKYEFGYDGFGYTADEHLYDHIEFRGYAFTASAHDAMTNTHPSTPTRFLGGCCFRNNEYSDGFHWHLDWVWLHPYERSQKILSKHWHYFEATFGKDFLIQPPISPAMNGFLVKQGHRQGEAQHPFCLWPPALRAMA